MIKKINPEDPEEYKHFREFLGPQQVDQLIRHAIQSCWMGLPRGRQNVKEVEKQIRRIVDRALRDLREDASAFSLGG